MTCEEIMAIIEETYPKEAALGFDNVGLQAGRCKKEVKRIYLALDATESVISAAILGQADMLITHHPLIFTPIRSVTDEDFVGSRLVKLIQHDISYYAMHTNYDVLGMAELAGKLMNLLNPEVLEVTTTEGQPKGIGRVGILQDSMTLGECCEYVKHRLKLESVRVFGDLTKEIHTMAISPGSGKGMVEVAARKGADVLVSGDIGHHEGLDAVDRGMSVIDAGHYGTEYIFIEDMSTYFRQRLPGLEVMTADICHPFQTV